MFPAASEAVQVTVVMPTGKNDPDWGVHVMPPDIPMLSVATGLENVIILPAGFVV